MELISMETLAIVSGVFLIVVGMFVSIVYGLRKDNNRLHERLGKANRVNAMLNVLSWTMAVQTHHVAMIQIKEGDVNENQLRAYMSACIPIADVVYALDGKNLEQGLNAMTPELEEELCKYKERLAKNEITK